MGSRRSGYKILGIRVSCAVDGGGTISMVAWMMQVESDSHWGMTSWRRFLVSFDLSSLGGILRFNVVTILDTFSGFLAGTVRTTRASVENKECVRFNHDSVVYCPYVFKYELHEQGLQVPPL